LAGGPLALELVRRACRRLWSPATPDAAAQATIRALGADFGAARRDAASLLEKAWVELAWAAGQASDFERLRGLVQSGAQPYAVIGDSHGRLLVRRARAADGRWLLPLWWLETGASARGLGRAEARSGAGERVRAAIDAALAATDAAPLLLKFGQVDVEFVQVFKRLETGVAAFDPADFQAFIDETVARYVAFVASAVAPADRRRVGLCGLFPPALSDTAWRAGYVNAHMVDLYAPSGESSLTDRLAGLDIPDLTRRTALHADFNAALKAAAAAEGFGVHDDFTPFLGPAGVVDPGWLGPAAGHDHHLDFSATRAPVVDRLLRLLEGSRDSRDWHDR